MRRKERKQMSIADELVARREGQNEFGMGLRAPYPGRGDPCTQYPEMGLTSLSRS